MKTPRQVAEKVQGFLGVGVGKAEPYSFMLYRSAFILYRNKKRFKHTLNEMNIYLMEV